MGRSEKESIGEGSLCARGNEEDWRTVLSSLLDGRKYKMAEPTEEGGNRGVVCCG